MGMTVPSITEVFMKEEQAYTRFRRALRREDQEALDDLFEAAKKHLAVVAYSGYALPFEAMLLAMLLEEHKLVMRLFSKMNSLLIRIPIEQPRFEIPKSALQEDVARFQAASTMDDRLQYGPVEESS